MITALFTYCLWQPLSVMVSNISAKIHLKNGLVLTEYWPFGLRTIKKARSVSLRAFESSRMLITAFDATE
jgi:hypothetical protein